MKYFPELSHDTKLLSCSFGNREKMLFNGHLSIKSHTQYNHVIRLLHGSSTQIFGGFNGDELYVTWRLS